jgi:hypothetical protein
VAHARQAGLFLEVMQLWQARAEMLLLHWRGSTMLPLTQPSAVNGMAQQHRKGRGFEVEATQTVHTVTTGYREHGSLLQPWPDATQVNRHVSDGMFHLE